MKLFLLIILLTFQEAAADARDWAVEITGKEYFDNLEKNTRVQSAELDFFATVTTEFSHRRHYKNIPHYRQHSFARDLYNIQSFRKPFADLENTFFVARYSYCKPIGLFLIFPQHYFW